MVNLYIFNRKSVLKPGHFWFRIIGARTKNMGRMVFFTAFCRTDLDILLFIGRYNNGRLPHGS